LALRIFGLLGPGAGCTECVVSGFTHCVQETAGIGSTLNQATAFFPRSSFNVLLFAVCPIVRHCVVPVIDGAIKQTVNESRCDARQLARTGLQTNCFDRAVVWLRVSVSCGRTAVACLSVCTREARRAVDAIIGIL
jgi:hypothetical protein